VLPISVATLGFAKMPEFFMPAPTAPIFAAAGSAGTRKRILFGIEISEKDFFSVSK
jgi:hypothetical protein